MPRNQRLASLAIAAVIAVAAVVLLAGGDDEKSSTTATTPTPAGTTTGTETAPPAEGTPTQEPTPAEIVLAPGKEQRIEATEGDQLQFTVRSDTADEVHLHGYNIKKDIEAGGEVEFALKATITGIFEIELENAGVTLGQLVVQPK